MFDKQYRFAGSYAEKVSALTSVFDDVAKAKLFERNLDVYMNAPLIGFFLSGKGSKTPMEILRIRTFFRNSL